jgi:hypothetical protein
MSHDSEEEKTPLESPYSLKQVMLKLGSIEVHAASAANNSMRTAARVDKLVDALELLARRVTALEITRGWGPYVLGAIALAIGIWNAAHH